MGFWDGLKGQFVDVIEWTDDDGRTLATRFERHGDEIKYGARLVVREGQAAVFVREGRLADVFTPGTYTLETRNLPILSTLAAWKHGFESPFKAEVWFVSTRQFTGLKWGTKNPVITRDPEFGAVRLRAFGTFSVRVVLPARFLKEIVGTESHLGRDEISHRLRDFVVARFGDLLGESRIPLLDLAARYDELGNFLEHRAREDFHQYGLAISDLFVENVSLPPEVEAAIDKRTSMGILGDLDDYFRFQAAEALPAAAEQPGGGAGTGLGIGMGMAMAREFTKEPSPPTAPPPLPTRDPLHVAEDGRAGGPYPPEAIDRMIASGRLTAESLVWRTGLETWVPARELAELASRFHDSPPPLPPR